MKYGCIGEKLGHSFSAVIHKKIGLYEYELCPVERKKLSDFMTCRDFDGINVTIPYKKDVIPFLKEISEEAVLCGAVNTIVNRNGDLYGFNTDFLGMRAMLEYGKISVEGKKVLILGSGGTSGTAEKLCESLGAKEVYRVSRTGKGGLITYEEAVKKTDTEVIINTTPCGMFPEMGKSPIDLSHFPNLSGVADAIYNPRRTVLLLDAEKRGIPCIDGLFMLVSQAVYAAEIFTGKKGLSSVTEAIYKSVLEEKRNLVLIGMPASGKSTIGKELSRILNFPFLDTDEEIVKKEGMEIPEIFAEKGEGYFRDLESSVISEIAPLQGRVIATGGGAVLREENVSYLKGNGVLLFLDAPLESLISTEDRPLTSNPEDMKKKYEERYDIYKKNADLVIPITRNLSENIEKILKVLK
ncbi:MAG: shikimate dehydrogenase [Clostridia bacterium]|nr:shikimate dehydrogenase [Clostridia bacterium]